MAQDEGTVPVLPDDPGIESAIDMSPDPFSIPAELKRILEEKKAAMAARPKEEPVEEVATEEVPEPEPAPPPELPKVSLTGVVYNVENPLAVINGQVFAEGETMTLANNAGAVQVRSIGAGKVVLLYMGMEHTVTIDEQQSDPNSGQ